MPHPASFLCEEHTDSIPSFFRRNNVDNAIIARQLGVNPKRLNSWLADWVTFCDGSRRNASCRNVPTPDDRSLHEVSESHVWTSKKNVTTLKDLISLYYSLDGLKREWFEGTCTTVLVSMQCGRRALAIEGDPVCFQLAVRRLGKFARIPRDRTEACNNATINTTICGKTVNSVMCDSVGTGRKHNQELKTGGVRMTNKSQTLTDCDMALSLGWAALCNMSGVL